MPQGDSFDAYRVRLKEVYTRLHERATTFAAEIGRDAPSLTVHDATHLDALWEMAELIIGSEQLTQPDPFLNPLETFVLGCAFLTHDLAHSKAALKMSSADVLASPRYQELMHRYLTEKSEDDDVSTLTATPEDHEEVLQTFLREKHASAAGRLLLTSWEDVRGNHQYLLSDPELRESLGETIGRIAASHHWPVSRLQEFDIVGAPACMPAAWQCDLLMLASILRVADVSHIDSRRAPSMLSALRKPKFISKRHWSFQNRLNHPVRREDRILYTSTVSFPLSSADAWWLCFDTLNYINHELSSVDSLLLESRRRRFSLKAVVGVEDPRRLSKHIPTQGWQPVDTQIRVGNVASLVRKLGGEQLYGHNLLAPVRELIQNACDAVRARRLLEQTLPLWGSVKIHLEQIGPDWILQVTDEGIGMSASVLTGPLLDFGNSYWNSSEASRELPELSSNKFKSTGRFGIGFFSVFMLGKRVKLASRRYDAGVGDARVLEFSEGSDSRPLLRVPAGNEFRSQGTRIEVHLKSDPHELGGFLNSDDYDIPSGTLREMISWLCPCSEVTLITREGQDPEEIAVTASDWRTLDAGLLLERVEQLDRGSGPGASIRERCAPFIRPILGSNGDLLGRACFLLHDDGEGRYSRDCSTIVVGGSRAQNVYQMAGVILGTPDKASRDEASPLATEAELTQWAEEQRQIIAAAALSPSTKAGVANLLISDGLRYDELPFVFSSTGWLTFPQLVTYLGSLDTLKLVERHYPSTNGFNNFGSYVDGVLIVSPRTIGLGSLIPRPRERNLSWRNPLFHIDTPLGELIKAAAQVWNVSAIDLLASAVHSTPSRPHMERVAQDIYGNPILDSVDIFSRNHVQVS